MDEIWRLNRFRNRLGVFGLFVVSLLCQNFDSCWSLNSEGLTLLRFREKVVNDPFGALLSWRDDRGDVDPCFWFGVECSDGKVVVLNLKDLCLEGTLTPELKNLVHIKSIILRNNSFSGDIPEGIGKLMELEVLDLGYNNLKGPIPADLGNNLSLGILLLDNNRLLYGLSPEIYELQLLSQFQVDESLLSNILDQKSSSFDERTISWNSAQNEDSAKRRLLQEKSQFNRDPNPPSPPSPSPPSPSPQLNSPPPPTNASQSTVSPSGPTNQGQDQNPNNTQNAPSLAPQIPLVPPPTENSTLPVTPSTSLKSHLVVILVGTIGGVILLIASGIGVYLCASNKVTTVRPWATGLSGQLQKAFVSGVPKLKRTELMTACEDFSNVIGYSPLGKLYKGTLSSGVEIAVASIAVESVKDWSKNLEVQFRMKIETLSKVNHKNFVNLVGYCEEEEPFTRMMVFEYAPNGTLFEHLHVEEAEQLDWGMRMRIAVGMAYCLGHMHQLNPPIPHNNLTSSYVNLAEDYAAKISDINIWTEMDPDERKTSSLNLLNISSETREGNVYSFGIILLELVTGRLPYPEHGVSLVDSLSNYLRSDGPTREIVDRNLESFEEEQLEQIGQVLRSCLHSDPTLRPTMREVSERLRLITGITPDGANPKISALWWAELEIIASDAH